MIAGHRQPAYSDVLFTESKERHSHFEFRESPIEFRAGIFRMQGTPGDAP